MLLNCDLGEIDDPRQTVEKAVMPHIDLANVCCGGHAGTTGGIAGTLALAAHHGVVVGAHPGYADRENFGRMSIPHSGDELAALLHRQVAALQDMAATQGLALDYVKPHGALYNDMMADPDVLTAILKALAAREGPRKLMLLATGDSERHRQLAARFGVALLFETFADRRYDERGFLTPRRQPGAVLDHRQMLEQVQQLCEDGTVTTSAGTVLAIDAETLCVHGDTPDAPDTIAQIRALIAGRQSSPAGNGP